MRRRLKQLLKYQRGKRQRHVRTRRAFIEALEARLVLAGSPDHPVNDGGPSLELLDVFGAAEAEGNSQGGNSSNGNGRSPAARFLHTRNGSVADAATGGQYAPVIQVARKLPGRTAEDVFVAGELDAPIPEGTSYVIDFFAIQGRNARHLKSQVFRSDGVMPHRFQAVLPTELQPNERIVAQAYGAYREAGAVSHPIPVIRGSDADRDGVDDDIEQWGSGAGDRNRNGKLDGTERSFVALPAATNGSPIAIDAKGASLKNVYGERLARGIPGAAKFPLGLIGFELHDVPVGGIAQVGLEFPDNIDIQAYYKQDPQTGSLERFDYDGQTGAIINGQQVTLYLRDGGRGDADGLANGVILDPGGSGGNDPIGPFHLAREIISTGSSGSACTSGTDVILELIPEPAIDAYLGSTSGLHCGGAVSETSSVSTIGDPSISLASVTSVSGQHDWLPSSQDPAPFDVELTNLWIGTTYTWTPQGSMEQVLSASAGAEIFAAASGFLPGDIITVEAIASQQYSVTDENATYSSTAQVPLRVEFRVSGFEPIAETNAVQGEEFTLPVFFHHSPWWNWEPSAVYYDAGTNSLSQHTLGQTRVDFYRQFKWYSIGCDGFEGEYPEYVEPYSSSQYYCGFSGLTEDPIFFHVTANEVQWDGQEWDAIGSTIAITITDENQLDLTNFLDDTSRGGRHYLINLSAHASATSPPVTTPRHSTDFLLHVTNGSDAPPHMDVISNYSINEGVELRVPVTAYDTDGSDIIELSVSGPPGVQRGYSLSRCGSAVPPLGYDPYFGAVWTPDESQGPGVYEITVTATECSSPQVSTSKTFTVTVLEVNRPPLLELPYVGTIDEMTLFEATLSAGDPDIPANTLSYSVSAAWDDF